MNRRSILTVSALAALGLAVLPGSAVGQQKPLKEQLALLDLTLVSADHDKAPIVAGRASHRSPLL